MAILSTFEPKSSSVGGLLVPDIDEVDKNSENADDTMETQQQIFKDAMKLGGAVMQLINMHRKKQFAFK